MQEFRFILCFVCCCGLLPLAGQNGSQDTSVSRYADLPLVTFSSSRQETGQAGDRHWDSLALARQQSDNVAELLSEESSVFIKSYGLGSLATSSVRGGSAAQTLVLWNGLPLENPMLGLLDLAQLNTDYFSSVQLTTGGQSAGYGSGAVAGAIHLDNHTGNRKPAGFELGFDAGSFGFAEKKLLGYFGSANQKWRFSTRLNQRSAQNDFRYYAPREDAYVRQANAALEQAGFLQEIYYRPKAGTALAFRLWGQTADKEIPPTSVQRSGQSRQGDDFVRASLHVEQMKENSRLVVRSGLFRETIDFRDERNDLRAVSHFWKGLLEIEQAWYLKHNWQLTGGWSGQWLEGETSAYGEARQQVRAAAFARLRYRGKRWTTVVSARQETVDGRFIAPVPALHLAYAPDAHWTFHLEISRNFRLPALNDLYWTPGGRPDLLPERGWSQEAGLAHQRHNERFGYEVSLTAYHRHLRNWIQWAPAPGEAFWSAANLTRVRSYGLSPRASVHWQVGKQRLRLAGGAEVLRSRNQEYIELPRMEAGAQLIYTPEVAAFASLSYSGEGWEVAYHHGYTGERNGINVAVLDPYDLGRLRLAGQLKIKNHLIGCSAKVENLWNREYRVIERRRMPGRHVQLGLQLIW